jgi:WD40 repeat protein
MTTLTSHRLTEDGQPGITLDAQHPWPGLVSFTEELRKYFHGRDEELDELFGRVTSTILTVLFGESGLGKTSLVQAGLFPRLRGAGFLPVPIRLDPGAAPAYAAQVKDALLRALEAAGKSSRALGERDQTLWEYFHRRVAGGDNGENAVRMVLVFDQFEELFSHGRGEESASRITAFFAELGDLIENRIPAGLRKSFEENPKRMKEFDFQRQDHRVLLSLREDYLARLEELRSVLPAILDNRMRLTRMNGAQALEAVTEPGAGLIAQPVARQIVRFVAGAGDASKADVAALEVEPWLLSLVCFELNVQRLHQQLPKITEDLLAGSRDQILQKFYHECLHDQPPGMRVFIEEDLLTHGLRDSVELKKAEQILGARGVPATAIRELVQKRLLHLESRRGMQRVELTHDVLTSVVKKSRDERRQQESQRELTEKLKRNRKRVQWLAGAVVVAMGVVGVVAGLAVLAWSKAGEAHEAKTAVEESLEEKKKALLTAEEAKRSAERSLQGEKWALKNAELAKLEAERALENEKSTLRNLAHVNYNHSVSLAYRERSTGNLSRFEGLLNSCPPEFRNWDWHFLKGLGRKELFSFREALPPYAVAFSRDGRWLAHAGDSKNIVVRKAATGDLVHVLPRAVSPVSAASLVALLAAPPGELTFLEARALFPQAHQATVLALAFSPDGRLLASASMDKTVKVWDVLQGKEIYVCRHGDDVTAVGFSPDGKRIASLSKEPFLRNGKVDGPGTIKIWDLRGTIHFEAPCAASLMSGLAFDSSGQLLACPSDQGSGVALWNTRTRQKELPDFQGHSRQIYGVAFSPDGRYLASASLDGTVKIWDTTIARKLKSDSGIYSAGSLVRNLSHDDAVSCVAFSPDGTRLVSGSWDQSVKLWDVLAGREISTFRGHTNLVLGVSFSADGGYVASAGYDGNVKVWETDRSQQLSAIFGPVSQLYFQGVTFDPTGRKLIGSGLGDLRAGIDGVEVWDVDTGRRICRLNQQGDWGSVAVSSDGRFIAVGEGALNPRGKKDGLVVVWDVQRQALHKTLRGHADWITGVAFRPGSAELASSSKDGTIKIWDLGKEGPPRSLQHHDPKNPSARPLPVWGIAYSANGDFLASAGDDKTVRIWDAAKGEELTKKPLEGHTLPVRCVAFSLGADVRQLFSGAGDTLNAGEIIVWGMEGAAEKKKEVGPHPERWKALHRLPNVRGSVTGLAVHPQGRLLAASSINRSVMIYDVSRGQELFTLSGFQNRLTGVSWQPGEGRHLACADGQDISVWTVNPSPELFTLRGQTKRINSIAFNSDGKRLVSVSDDATVQLWDTATGQADGPPLEPRERKYYSTTVAWSSDDKLLAYDNGKALRIRSLVDGTVIRDLPFADFPSFATFSPGRELLALSFTQDKTIRVYDTATWEERHVLRGHDSNVISLAFSPSGNLLASTGRDKSVRIWDPHSGKQLNTLNGHTDSVQEVVFLDEAHVASSSKDKTVRIWDALAKPVRTLRTLKGHMVPVWSIAYDPTEKKLVSADEIGLIKVWDLDTGRELATVRGHAGSVGYLTYCTKSRHFASAGSDATVRLWDMSRLKGDLSQSQERARWLRWHEREGLSNRDLALKDGMLDIEGALVATDRRDRVRTDSFCKIYSVKLVGGKSYQIDMMAGTSGFDPYLRVETDQGKELAKDDEGGRSHNARIVFPCPRTATYRIVANSYYKEETGPFSLRVEEIPPSSVVSIPLEDGLGQVKDRLASTDPKDRVLIGSACKTYSVELAGGSFYYIDMSAATAGTNRLDCNLRVEDAEEKELAQNAASGQARARILFSCPRDGHYRLIATTSREQLGEFALLIRKAVPNVLSLNNGAAKTEDKLAAADLRDRVNTNSPCKIYLVNLAADNLYEFEMTSSKILDASLRLEDAQGKVLAQRSLGAPTGLGKARAVFYCPQDGTYQVIATSSSGQTGVFALSVGVLPLSPAMPLTLKDRAVEVKAELSPTDSTDHVTDSAGKVYSLEMAGGKIYQLDLIAGTKGFDPNLRLEDTRGKQLAQQAGFGSPRVRILFSCPHDGVYRIVATTSKGRTGEYTLVVRSSTPTTLTLTNGAAHTEGELAATDLKDRFNKDSPFKIFLVQLAADKIYRLEMTGSKALDVSFRVEDGQGKGLARSARPAQDGGVKAHAAFYCPKDGVYQVFASSSSGRTGPFALNVRIDSSPLDPATPLTLENGMSEIIGELTAADPMDRLRIDSACKIYSLDLAAGKTYQIDMITRTTGFDPYLRLEDAEGKQLAKDDDSGGFPNARIVFPCERAGTYRIIATAYEKTGAYLLRVQEK